MFASSLCLGSLIKMAHTVISNRVKRIEEVVVTYIRSEPSRSQSGRQCSLKFRQA